MTLDELLPYLDRVQQRGPHWSARCPAHEDSSPSLSVAAGESGILLKCWAGCTFEDICKAMNLRPRELFYDARNASRIRRPTSPQERRHATSVAFQFELMALELRLRSSRVDEALKAVQGVELSDADTDRLMEATYRAMADIERAELFESITDGLRVRAFNRKNGAGHAVSR